MEYNENENDEEKYVEQKTCKSTDTYKEEENENAEEKYEEAYSENDT